MKNLNQHQYRVSAVLPPLNATALKKKLYTSSKFLEHFVSSFLNVLVKDFHFTIGNSIHKNKSTTILYKFCDHNTNCKFHNGQTRLWTLCPKERCNSICIEICMHLFVLPYKLSAQTKHVDKVNCIFINEP